MAKKIEMCEQDQIEQYGEIAREFFRDILDMDYDQCLVTDESALSDFSSCGLPEDIDPPGGLKELYAAWDEWVKTKIQLRYDVRIESTSIYFVTLFEQVLARKNQKIH